MNPALQALFDTCVLALLKHEAFPEPSELATGNLVIGEFRTIRDTMHPRTWKSEVRDMAADYEFEFNSEVWEQYDYHSKAQHA